MNTFICPHCGETVEISEAIAHQFKEQAQKELDGKHKADIERIRLEESKRVASEFDFKLKNTEQEAAETKLRNKQLQEQLTELMRSLRELKQKDDERDLQMQKELSKAEEKIELQITQREQEKARMDKLEMQKKLEDMQKALEDAQRKGQQSSQQLQGEVLELDLETQLKAAFQTDEIKPVPKGIEGADIIQTVKNRIGQTAGAIIWEAKRTKAWSNTWLPKLREEKRATSAQCAILISEVLPPGIETFGYHEQVWVTTYKYAIPLAETLRISILQIAQARSTAANKDEKLEALYQYLTTSSFKHRFESQVEVTIELRNDLEAEQRSVMRMWKKKEMQIERMKNNIAGMYGELQGILGSALPSLPGLEMNQLTEGENDENDTPKTLF